MRPASGSLRGPVGGGPRRPTADHADGTGLGHRVALRSLARRYQALDKEVEALEVELDRLLAATATSLVARKGVRTDSAGALLAAVGDNPERLRSEAALAGLCGTSPVEASSGKVTRYGLNRGGDRQANAALYRIVINRLSWDERTKHYMARRTAEGKTTKEIIRCLKRYVVREIHRELKSCFTNNSATAAAWQPEHRMT